MANSKKKKKLKVQTPSKKVYANRAVGSSGPLLSSSVTRSRTKPVTHARKRKGGNRPKAKASYALEDCSPEEYVPNHKVNKTKVYMRRLHRLRSKSKYSKKHPSIISFINYAIHGKNLNMLSEKFKNPRCKLFQTGIGYKELAETFETYIPFTYDEREFIFKYVFRLHGCRYILRDNGLKLLDILSKYKSYLSSYFKNVETTFENAYAFVNTTYAFPTENNIFGYSVLFMTNDETAQACEKLEPNFNIDYNTSQNQVTFSCSYINEDIYNSIKEDMNSTNYPVYNSIDTDFLYNETLQSMDKSNDHIKLMQKILMPFTTDNLIKTSTINNIANYDSEIQLMFNMSPFSFHNETKFKTAIGVMSHALDSNSILSVLGNKFIVNISPKENGCYLIAQIIKAFGIKYSNLPYEISTEISKYIEVLEEITDNKFPTVSFKDGEYHFTNISSSEKDYIDAIGR